MNSINDDAEETDLIDELADEFISRWQAGQSPAETEYCERHPDLEREIRELFPC